MVAMCKLAAGREKTTLARGPAAGDTGAKEGGVQRAILWTHGVVAD
jgi:hypothetical protein